MSSGEAFIRAEIGWELGEGPMSQEGERLAPKRHMTLATLTSSHANHHLVTITTTPHIFVSSVNESLKQRAGSRGEMKSQQ